MQLVHRYVWRINIPILLKHFENIAKFPELHEGFQFDGPVLFVGGSRSDYIQ